MNSKNALTLLIIAIMSFGAGFFIDREMLLSQNNREIVALQSQVEHAKKFFPPEAPTMTSVSGTVKSVAGNIITLDASLPNPFADLPVIRTIRVTNRTVINKLVQKDQATLQKEYLEFQKKLVPGMLPPSPLREMVGTLADLQEGQSVTVTADGDIATKASFDAASIQITILTPSLPTQQPPSR